MTTSVLQQQSLLAPIGKTSYAGKNDGKVSILMVTVSKDASACLPSLAAWMYDILKYNSAPQHPQIYCTNVCANVTDMYDKCTHEAETAATLCCACVEEHNPHASAPRQPLQHTKTLWSACANPSLMISFSAFHVIAKFVIRWYEKRTRI